MKTLQNLAICVATLLLLAGCATSNNVFSDYDRQADFGRYTTYRIMQPQNVDPGNTAFNQMNQRRIYSAIEQQMKVRQYEPSEEPHIKVYFYVKTKQRIDANQNPNPWGWGWGWGGGNMSIREYEEGALVIDIVDSRDNLLVWQGVTTGDFYKASKKKSVDEKIWEAVQRVFDSYPFIAGNRYPIIDRRS